MSALTTVSSPAELDPCPYCGITTEVQSITGTSRESEAWSCSACQTNWAIAVDPRLFLAHLAATVELAMARPVLREVITLANQAPGLADDQLRFRLLALAACATPRSTAASRSPADRWSRRPPTLFPTASRSQIPPMLNMPISQQQEVAGDE